MILNCKKYRENTKPEFLYNKNPEKPDIRESMRAFEADFFKETNLPSPEMGAKEVSEWVKETFRQKFSPEKYEEGLREYIRRHVAESGETERLLKNAVQVYRDKYKELQARFYKITEEKITNYEEARKGIQEATKAGLETLSQALQNISGAKTKKAELADINPTAPAFKEGRLVDEIPIVGPLFKNVDIPIISFIIDSKEYRQYKAFQRETSAKFTEFNAALSKKYLNLKLQKSPLTEAEYKRYENLAENFDDGMKNYVENQLEFIFANTHDKDILKQRLDSLRDGILKTYQEKSGDDGILDLAELERMEAEATEPLYLLKYLHADVGDEVIAAKFESSQYFNKDVWKEAVGAAADQLIKDAEANGSEAAFIELVKKWTGSKADMNFKKAADEFKDIMAKRAETGVRETFLALREFNNAVNKERADILKLDDIKPSLRVMVYRERELLLGRMTVPKNIDDRLVVEFMGTNLLGRHEILNDPTRRLALFQAIQNIKKYYSEMYRGQYHRSIPKEVDKMTSSSDPDRPTRYDNIARLVAILTLANEAEWVVKNLSMSADYRGRGFDKELESSEAEKIPPKVDMKFRDPNKLYRIGYVTEAARNGFNGRDLGLSALKAVAGITIFMNFMNTWSRAKKGHRLEDMAKLAVNPYMIGAGFGVYGIGRVQKNPEAMGYFLEDAGGKERIAVHLGLTKIAEKTGNVSVFNFIGNSDEFRAMLELMKEPDQGVRKVKKMIEKVKKQNPKNPVITKEDLKDILEPETLSQLPNVSNDRMRYLFYERFLMTPRNIRELKANCLKWK